MKQLFLNGAMTAYPIAQYTIQLPTNFCSSSIVLFMPIRTKPSSIRDIRLEFHLGGLVRKSKSKLSDEK